MALILDRQANLTSSTPSKSTPSSSLAAGMVEESKVILIMIFVCRARGLCINLMQQQSVFYVTVTARYVVGQGSVKAEILTFVCFQACPDQAWFLRLVTAIYQKIEEMVAGQHSLEKIIIHRFKSSNLWGAASDVDPDQPAVSVVEGSVWCFEVRLVYVVYVSKFTRGCIFSFFDD